MRVVYFGSGATGIPALKMLLDDPRVEVAAVVTQPDKPAGRKLVPTPTPVRKLLLQESGYRIKCIDFDSSTGSVGDGGALTAAEGEILLTAPESVRGNKPLRQMIRSMKAEALVVISFGQILTNLVLETAPWAVCAHASALPRLRGPSPVRTALLLGMTETEACTFLMTPRMDDGDVLLRTQLHFPEGVDFSSACQAFSLAFPELLRRTLFALADGTITPTPQDHAQATYCRLINREDACVDWSQNPHSISNTARAFYPDICASSTFRGKLLKLGLPVSVSSTQAEADPGSILEIDASGGKLVVACGGGAIELEHLKLEGGKWLTIREFANGFRPKKGEAFVTPREILQRRRPLVTFSRDSSPAYAP